MIADQDEQQILPGTYCDQWYFNNKVKGTLEYYFVKRVPLNPREWNLRSFALNEAIRDGSVAQTRILHTRPFEAQEYCKIELFSFLGSHFGLTV